MRNLGAAQRRPTKNKERQQERKANGNESKHKTDKRSTTAQFNKGKTNKQKADGEIQTQKQQDKDAHVVRNMISFQKDVIGKASGTCNAMGLAPLRMLPLYPGLAHY